MILGIESSCDETAAAVVEDGRAIRSSVVASQLDVHARYGGVVPELASREHLRAIVPVVRESLDRAGTQLSDLDAIAVTQGPGLIGSLLVGITYGKALCFASGKPLIAVNHLEGHIHAVAMEAGDFDYPAVALIASGGHTHLFVMPEPERYELAGKTRDDAAGEAYDKVAKLLGFSYPGGPILDRIAPFGNPNAVQFTSPKMKGNPMDFSFSGMKTAVLRWVEARDMHAEIETRKKLAAANPHASLDQWLELTPHPTRDLIASFQATVIDELLRRTIAVAENCDARTVIISGGVACNAGLRQAARNARTAFPIHFPTPSLSTDNAAMIAAAAFPKWKRSEFADFTLPAKASMPLAT